MGKIGRYLDNAAGISFKTAWKIFSKPRMVPVRLYAAPMAPVAAACRLFPEVPQARIDELHTELMGNHEFFDQLNRIVFAVRGRRLGWNRWNEFIYLAVRLLQPKVMVETGIFDGQSSAILLEAMRRNGVGQLISIDLPAYQPIEGATTRMEETALPPGKQPGWMIPAHLLDRHRLELGDARELLPRVVSEFAEIDIFFHDSLHTEDHMSFEYETAWPKIRKGGMLLSDDTLWNPAYYEFCRAHDKPYFMVSGQLGAIRK
ncbi:MAG: class I SAM-dependent methyltransferase [Bryobacterales bacterium]|nr:class I SAM-dependent methyltransferase [Bryobacterales bacterium]